MSPKISRELAKHRLEQAKEDLIASKARRYVSTDPNGRRVN